jgi:hypothetical protein
MLWPTVKETLAVSAHRREAPAPERGDAERAADPVIEPDARPEAGVERGDELDAW